MAQAAGYDYGPEFYDFCLEYLSRGGHHYPSMAVDMQASRPTEIDYINGKIVYYGLQLNVPVPVNFTMTSMVKAASMPSNHSPGGALMKAHRISRCSGSRRDL